MCIFLRWLETVDDKPGICSHVIQSLKNKRENERENYEHCVLMVDEMSIKKHVTWCPSEQRYEGYVNLGGTVIDADTDKIANNALVIMAVGIKKKWKCPISFHFTAGLTAATLTSLVRMAVTALKDINITTKVLVTDGLRSNTAAMNMLGCNLDDGKFWFSFQGMKIFCMLDQVHMIKVLRNVWAELKEIHDPHGIALWEDIENLIELQVCLILLEISQDRNTMT